MERMDNGYSATSAIRVGALHFRDQMHTTRLYFGVFAVVWLACLLWMQIAKRRRGASSDRPGTLWVGAISLLVLLAAILYGLGTRGVYPRRIPALMPVSDALALGFMLALPLITWFRIPSRGDDEDLEEDEIPSDFSARSIARLSARKDMSEASAPETASPPDIRPELEPADPQLIPHIPQEADSHATIAANLLAEDAGTPITFEPHLTVDDAPMIPAPDSMAPTASELPAETHSEFLSFLPVAPLARTPLEAVSTAPEPPAAEFAKPVSAVFSEPASVMSPQAAPIAFPASTAMTEEPAFAETPEPIATIPAALLPEHEISEPVPFHRPEPAAAMLSDLLSAGAPDTAPAPRASQSNGNASDHDLPAGIDVFRRNILGLYQSWQRIEAIQGEVDEWFERRRRQAVAHITTPPALRTSGFGDLVPDFPMEKITAIESEWANIRNLALKISRSVGATPEPDHND